MLLLTTTTDKIQIITGQAVITDVHASWVDFQAGTVTPGRTNTAISTATTTDVVAAPVASTQRNLKTLNVRNKHASQSVDITIVHTDGTTAVELFKTTLAPQATLEYVEGVGFFTVAPQLSFPLLTTAEGSENQRVLKSALPPHSFAAVGGFVMISGTAYYVYVGRITRDTTMAFVELHVTGAGAGAQTAELGLFSSTNPPNKSAQTLTKIVATGTIGSLTATGVVRNTTSFAQLVPAGTHLWAAMRTAMATTQPTVLGLESDMSEGHVETTTGAGALTGISTAAGSIVAISTSPIAPDLRVTLE